jgi:hypothetical protein
MSLRRWASLAGRPGLTSRSIRRIVKEVALRNGNRAFISEVMPPNRAAAKIALPRPALPDACGFHADWLRHLAIGVEDMLATAKRVICRNENKENCR